MAVTVMLSPILVTKNFYRFDWPIMMFASLLFFGFIFDGVLVFWEGSILFLLLLFVIVYLVRFQEKAVIDDEHESSISYSILKTIFYFVLGSIGLSYGSQWLIDGAVMLSTQLGVSERVIGITLVSVGTSIPELVASVMAVLRKEKAISIGNLIGSNLFNILAVLGITAMITPIEVVDNTLLNFDVYAMLLFAFIILPLVFFPSGLRLGWRDGVILLGLYILYLYITV
jgi:cation:H+ antiporter